ncbi:MAG: SAM-dependent methyltransferase [Chloroflexota bacterium]|nr:SAM-dependent methyltransferase [Chloroflexota bacterium]
MSDSRRIGGSFRDPNGFVFVADGLVYRQVNEGYRSNYDQLMESDLYAELVDRALLIPHSEAGSNLSPDGQGYKILQPEQIPFISYPYEWSFSQLKDAALATLNIQRRALRHGMILKDASAYNIQFRHGKPLLIDSLSFETYQDGQAWVAYRQFCQHFLAPLVLMSRKDIRLSQLLRVYIDGIPLDLAKSLLPKRTWLNLGVVMHLHLHARAQQRYANKKPPAQSEPTSRRGRLDKKALMNICDSLRSTVNGLKWDPKSTSWARYYEGDSYREEGFDDKYRTVTEYLSIVKPDCLWDLGANTGAFSRIASDQGAFTVSIDSDPGAVEANYLQSIGLNETQLHPLLVDLTNPSAALGWANGERDSLAQRCKADCVLALALVHHLAIGNNVPLRNIAKYLAALAEWLIIEFVPKSDAKVKVLLASRQDIFADYTQSAFEDVFSEICEIVRSNSIQSSERRLYLMRRRPAGAS